MFILRVLILLVINLTIAISNKLDDALINEYNNFFNFGGKKLSNTFKKNKYENEILKSKIDVLGAVFKRNVDVLKSQGILDLVFLIDASSSVGENNFKSELKFVKKFLSDVTVDYNHTRVAVVTFSSQNSIIRNIDEISRPNEDNNKCLLLNEEIKNIKYTGGGTYTIGAFKIAQKIFRKSRKNAKKILFLITDGFSNGGNPVPIANQLKTENVTIFTIGIINGNFKELFELSTQPGEVYSYLLDSFEEFESLARRALHVDLQIGDYIPLNNTGSCSKLCTDSECCDGYAVCTCGTSTGHYNCLCKPGYYGSGLKGSCTPCPSGTYASGTNACVPCPDVHHITRPPAIGISSCICKSGYQADENNECGVIKCPKLQAPENGYFVKRKECSNVLNSACGVRCNVGYTLIGSSIRLCQANNTWSGLTPSCEIKTCNKLQPPLHGSMSCKHYDLNEDFTSETYLPVDTVCNFSCEAGRTIVGSHQRTCLPLARWDGLKTSCKQIKCNKLSKINFGHVEPKSCTIGKQAFGKECNFFCEIGYELVGPDRKVCNGQHGNWDKQDDIICTDVTKPKILCPGNVTGECDPGKPFGYVTWFEPNVTDNSNLAVTLWSKPAIDKIEEFKFKIGITKVIYFAQDASKNKAKCSFFVNILDNEAPKVEGCVDPPPFLTLSKEGENITWDEPEFFDNSQHIEITKISNNTSFLEMGTTSFTYKAVDPSGNIAECILNITVQESKCEIIQDPIYGRSECEKYSDSMQCVVTCDEGYAIPISQPIDTIDGDNGTKFICEHSQPIWYNKEGGSFPECSVSVIPLEVHQIGSLDTETEDDICADTIKLNQFEKEVSEDYKGKLDCEGYECELKTRVNCTEYGSGEKENNDLIKRSVDSTDSVIKKKSKRRRKKLRLELSAKLNIKNLKNQRSSKMSNFGLKRLNLKVEEDKMICPGGHIRKKFKCVICPVGTFYNASSNTCQSCPIGTYNSMTGQIKCVQCPLYHSTRKLHSKSQNDCIEQCAPGTIARKKQIKHSKTPNSITERITLKPFCRSCPLGQYQSKYGHINCINCPDKLTTFNRGAAAATECVQNSAEVCNAKKICNLGTCSLEDEFSYSCSCNEGFIGSHCEVEAKPCFSNPCQNNATCVDTGNGYTCKCQNGYEGDNCAIVSSTCRFTCQNGGTCVHVDDEDVCICEKNYAGDFCQEKVKFCEQSPCENGYCEESDESFKCVCNEGYLGLRCNYLPCDYRPCNEQYICLNIATKDTTRESYKCVCPNGFKGDNCTEKIDFCEQTPCKNNATCTNLEETYNCSCLKGYEGPNCEYKLRSDYILKFPRSSTTDFIRLDGFKNDLFEISVCLWMKTSDNFNYGTILSYATESFDNAFTITDYSGLVLYINNKYVVTDVMLNDGNWHHFCIVWTTANGHYEVYLDGLAVQSGKDLNANQTIKGGGKLVIGQEQDALGGKFSQSESFMGSVAYLDIFSKALNENEITLIMNSCEDNNPGDLYAWAEFSRHIQGDIKMENSMFCLKCKEPTKLFNGYVEIINNTAYYTCNKGYELHDKRFENGRKCTKASEWEGHTEPICNSVNCGRPPFIHDGYIIGKKYNYLDYVEYRCNYGFNLTGTSKRICSQNATWTLDEPKCTRVKCPKFNLPDNSQITIVLDDETELNYENYTEDSFDVGTHLEIACVENAIQEGINMITCQINGLWDYLPGKCILNVTEIHKLACEIDHIPAAPVNGYVIEDSIEAAKEGKSAIIEYKCRDGYDLKGENTSTCIIDGYWSELRMICELKNCGEPPKFTNMIVKQLPGAPIDYQVGNMLTFECIKGYRSFGNVKLRCLSPGLWSRMHGRCLRISCGTPVIKSQTKIIGRSYLVNDVVTLICGEEKYDIKCSEDGKWKGIRGNC